MTLSDASAVSLDCETSVIILAAVAGVYTVLNIVLIVCIAWCACYRGKRKSQVRPLSPRNEYKSPSHNGYPPHINTRLSQSDSRALSTITESLPPNYDDQVIVTAFINNKDSPFISRNYNGEPAGEDDYWQRDSPVLMKSNAWEEKPDSPSDDTGSVFINQSARGSVVSLNEDIDGQSDSSSMHETRRAIVHRRRAGPRRTDSTKPLLMESESSTDISDTLYEEDSGSSSSPTQPTLANQMKVLTRHAGSRKNINRKTDSMRSLVGNMEEPYQSSTLPRLGRLPPMSAHRTSLQTLTENTTLTTQFSTDFTTATLGRPAKSRARHAPQRSHSLSIEAFATMERRKPRRPIKVEAPTAPKWFSSQTSLNENSTSEAGPPTTPGTGLNQPISPVQIGDQPLSPGEPTKPKSSQVEIVSSSNDRPQTPIERPRPKVSSPLPPSDNPALVLGPPKERKTSAEKRQPKISSPLPPTDKTATKKLKPQISSPIMFTASSKPEISSPSPQVDNPPKKRKTSAEKRRPEISSPLPPTSKGGSGKPQISSPIMFTDSSKVVISSPILSSPTSPIDKSAKKSKVSRTISPGETSLQRLSLNLANDIGLEDSFKVVENKFRSEV